MSKLLKPIITEKMTEMGEKLNSFGFIVEKSSNKLQIKAAVEKMYGVKVEEVNTMIFPAKAKQRYTKNGFTKGRTNSYKKAVVTLAEGDTIDFYSNV